MTATVSSSITIPTPQALPHEPIAAYSLTSKGARHTINALQSLYAWKGGTAICDAFSEGGDHLTDTTNGTKRYRIKTPMYAGITGSAPRLRFYLRRRRTNSGTWQINVNVVGGGNATYSVSATTGVVLQLLGELNIDDTAEYQQVEVEVNSYSFLLDPTEDFALCFSAIHYFNGSALPDEAGGYNRSVVPQDTTALDVDKAACVAQLEWARQMANDIYRHRVGTLIACTRNEDNPSLSLPTSIIPVVPYTILRPHVPDGVTSLQVWIFGYHYGTGPFGSSVRVTCEGVTSTEIYTDEDTEWVEFELDTSGVTDPLISISTQHYVPISICIYCNDASLP